MLVMIASEFGWSGHSETSWLTHFVFPVLTLGLTGPLMVVVGFGVFLVGAGQIYTAKLRRTGLVTGGLYRFVRNPMYLAVASIIIGQALLLGQLVLLPYAAAFGLAVWVFVHRYEEPVLQRRFGAEYDAYRRAVPAWWPRRTPWQRD